MPVVNTKSNLINNAEAVPATLSEATLSGVNSRNPVATVEKLSTDSNGSVYRMYRLSSSDRVHSQQLMNDAITGGTSYDVGLYDTALNGGAVVSQALFAAAIDLSTARTTPLEISHNAVNIDSIEKRVWELLGLTADPNKVYDVALTANTAGAGAGTISARATVVSSRAA